MTITISLAACATLLGTGARPALADAGAAGTAPVGAASSPLWVVPAEQPGAAPPAAEAHAGCGSAVIWSDGPAGSGTWSARPAAGGSLPVVLGTWHRESAGLAPLVEIGALPAGRYQLTVDGGLVAGRALVVDCQSAPPAAAAVRVVSAPSASPVPTPATDADGNTIPPVSDERLAASSRLPNLPGGAPSGLTGLLLAGLALAGGLILGAKHIA